MPMGGGHNSYGLTVRPGYAQTGHSNTAVIAEFPNPCQA
jgi:hypothetical protein